MTSGPSAERMRWESELRGEEAGQEDSAGSMIGFPENHTLRNFSNCMQLPQLLSLLNSAFREEKHFL